ncbi:hypothetical protein [Leifsonia xyli]|uniref:hypothetical protein n=1 Tax=Leifsonia xyli TaxID=1575 RepID=UPI0014315D79
MTGVKLPASAKAPWMRTMVGDGMAIPFEIGLVREDYERPAACDKTREVNISPIRATMAARASGRMDA